MALAGVVGHGDDRRAVRDPGLGQRRVDRAHREHRGDGNVRRADGLGAHEQDPRTALHGLDRLLTQPLHGRAQRAGSGFGEPGRAQRVALGHGVEQERAELADPALGRTVRQERTPRSQPRTQRHHGALPQVVDRGVRDLREPLTEERVHRTPVRAERRDRRVIAHRERRLDAVRGHRLQEQRELLARVAVRDLLRPQVCRLGQRHDGRLRQLDHVVGRPRSEGLPPRVLADGVLLQPAPRRVDAEQLARPHPAAPDVPVEVDHAGLGPADDQVVGDGVRQRTEPVAVERGAHAPAVGEHDRRRPVPRLHRARGPSVARRGDGVGGLVVLPRRRDQRGDRAEEVVAGRLAQQQLGRLVQHRGVRAAVVEGPAGDRERTSAPLHPAPVPLDRVDLAVVAQQAERLRALPRRRRVRREPLVVQGEPRLRARVGQVRVEGGQALGRRERLVRDGREAHRREVRGRRAPAQRSLGPPPGTERGAVGLPVRAPRPDQHRLRDPGERSPGDPAEGRGVGRDGPPPSHRDPFRPARVLDDPAHAGGVVGPVEQHRQPDPVGVGRVDPRTPDRRAGQLGRQQRARDRQQQSGAVAGPCVGRGRPTVTHACQRLHRQLHDVPPGGSPGIRHEADAAGVALLGAVPLHGPTLGASGFRDVSRP